MRQYLVIDLDYKQIRGVFATPQEADGYLDMFGNLRTYHSRGYMVVPVDIVDGKIEPVPEISNDDDSRVSWLDDYLGIKDELDELK